MPGTQQSSVARDIAAALSWWREAGVDCDFGDAATEWLADPDRPAPVMEGPRTPFSPAVPAATVTEQAPVDLGGDSSDWPQDLAAFQSWWMSEPSLDKGNTAGRIAPRGKAGARLLVLVEQPEAEDREVLLSGPHGKLVSAMLGAMGIGEDEAYFAAVLPRYTPLPDWQGLAGMGLGKLLLHHIRLAAPQRVIAMGSNIPSLLGHDPAQNPQSLLNLNHGGSTVPVLLGRGPDALMRARAKAAFWQRWLDWTGT